MHHRYEHFFSLSQEECHEERAFVRRFVRATWTRTWCTMIGSNMFTCVRDTSRGVRKINAATESPSAREALVRI